MDELILIYFVDWVYVLNFSPLKIFFLSSHCSRILAVLFLFSVLNKYSYSHLIHKCKYKGSLILNLHPIYVFLNYITFLFD